MSIVQGDQLVYVIKTLLLTHRRSWSYQSERPVGRAAELCLL